MRPHKTLFVPEISEKVCATLSPLGPPAPPGPPCDCELPLSLGLRPLKSNALGRTLAGVLLARHERVGKLQGS